jgi:hypothetical protein
MLSRIICCIQKPVAADQSCTLAGVGRLTNGRIEFSLKHRSIGYKIKLQGDFKIVFL